MTPSWLLQTAVLSLVAWCSGAVLFAGVAWWAGRRWGARALPVAWLVGTLAFTALATFRVRQVQTARGFTPEQQAQFPTAKLFVAMLALALAAVTLVVRRRLRLPHGKFGMRTALASAGAFLGGMLLFLLVYAAIDISAVIRR